MGNCFGKRDNNYWRFLDKNGNFMSAGSINKKYGLNWNFIHELQIRHSIPYTWKCIINKTRTENNIMHFKTGVQYIKFDDKHLI